MGSKNLNLMLLFHIFFFKKLGQTLQIFHLDQTIIWICVYVPVLYNDTFYMQKNTCVSFGHYSYVAAIYTAFESLTI
jgi:hypothetical protein